MATRYAVANGNWSSTATWDGGTLPSSTDDVYANGKTVNINQTVTVNSLRLTSNVSPAISAGGSFVVTAAATVTITAGILAAHNATIGAVVLTVDAGSAAVSVVSPTITPGSASGSFGMLVGGSQTGALNITGNIIGPASTADGSALYVGGSPSLLTINGDITGGTGSVTGTRAVELDSACDTTITGNITGGAAGHGLVTTTFYSGTLTINGNLTGGSANAAYGANLAGSSFDPANVTINGDVTGGTAYESAGLYADLTYTQVTVRGSIKPGNRGGGSMAIDSRLTGAEQLRISGDIYVGGSLPSTGPDGYWPIFGAWVAIDGEDLAIHLLDDGGNDVEFGQGGAAPSIPTNGVLYPPRVH